MSTITTGLTTNVYDKWTNTKTATNTTGATTGNNNTLANNGAITTGSDLSSWSDIGQFAANQALQNSTSAMLNKTLGQEGSLDDALQMTLANTFDNHDFPNAYNKNKLYHYWLK